MLEINPFVLQVIISNVPSFLTSGFFPILGNSFGASVVNIGLLFFLLRIGNIVGSLISASINNKYEPHKIGSASEVLFSLTTFLILISVINKNIELFITCAFFKGINPRIILSCWFISIDKQYHSYGNCYTYSCYFLALIL
ncbi:hypothetical protein [Fluviispira sanaruensis]|uniref:Uncharacterized protein n=1 Tax=Fluviispira sanaruensis TaxID=2493639 RepID=A0A4P2VI20_FLUSA|nr:hypothetical protein [Fluviispira sanaruensis]BBH52703.1 hypothetical protein JCM31447_11450 [Fluviispira sanaruensis]